MARSALSGEEDIRSAILMQSIDHLQSCEEEVNSLGRPLLVRLVTAECFPLVNYLCHCGMIDFKLWYMALETFPYSWVL